MKTLLSDLGANLMFVLTCLGVTALLVLAAAFSQKAVCKDLPDRKGPRYVAYMALFAALAGILMMLEIPLFFAPGFYKLDLSEMPVLICTFYLGPVAGVLCEFLKIFLFLCFHGTTSAFVGEFANFVVGCSMLLPASVLYHRHHGKKSALVALIAGTLFMTVVGSTFNAWYLLPKFAQLYGIPLETIVEMGTAVNPAITNVETLVLLAVVPFNLLKGAVLSAATFFLYKRISPILSRERKR